jgi:two-component system, NtrC family, nitrogen regulation sensor histidine kinase NtrY
MTMTRSTKMLVAFCASLAITAATSVVIARSDSPLAIALGVAVAAAVLLGAGCFRLVVAPKLEALDRLCVGLGDLGAGKVTARLGDRDKRALGDLGERFDALGSTLAAEQGDALRRKLLEAIGGWAPVAILLYADSGAIVYVNREARELFFEGRNPEGGNFLHMLQAAPEALRTALLSETDALFTLETGAERESYNLSKRYFEVEGESYTLVIVKQMTRELYRREADVYKRVIRVISHEFNNSLAPIISLIHSAKLIAERPEHLPKLEKVLGTIEERAIHLNTFLEGYASFARLPRPRPQVVAWSGFLDGIRALWPSLEVGKTPARPGYFDAAQMQQVLINLLKNADEAKKDESCVLLDVEATGDGGTLFRVTDRGCGMTSEVLKNALEPFFSTKERGSGVGLALCREIVEAHNGTLKIEAGDGGGTVVSCWVPGQGPCLPARTGRLTLSRG